MSPSVEVRRKVESVRMAEGAGATVRRVFPTGRLAHVDPFVMLDEFTVKPEAGFPDHPHGGFEAVTYMLEGAFRHRDNLGNDEVVSAGGVQRFTAGKRIVHSELPGSDETSHGLQLWVNLPRALKETEPSYQPVASAEIPESEEEGVRARTVAGEGSPVELRTAVRYVDVALEPGRSYDDQVPTGWSGLVYVLKGAVSVASDVIERGRAAILSGSGAVQLTGEGEARFVLIVGEPHGEPIRQRGSFVD